MNETENATMTTVAGRYTIRDREGNTISSHDTLEQARKVLASYEYTDMMNECWDPTAYELVDEMEAI